MSQALWYLSRATGLVSLLLVTASLVLGLLTSGRAASATWPRFAVLSLHRNLSLLTVAFVGVHVATAVIDPYAGIGWLDAVVPFGSVYRPFWLGLGALGLDLMLAVIVTSLLRHRLSLRAWRVVHLMSYALWPVVVVHGLFTDTTDRHTTWVLATYLLCGVAVLAALVRRLLTTHPDTTVRAEPWR